MNIKDKEITITIGELMQMSEQSPKSSAATYAGLEKTAFEIGKKYCIRTVTMIQTGKLVDVNSQELVLEDAAWVADTGRFHEFLKNPDNSIEVEMFPNDQRVIVGRGAIIDAVQLPTIPSSSK